MKKRPGSSTPSLAGGRHAGLSSPCHHSWLYNLIGISSPIAILVGVRIHKPARRAPWFLFALGQTLFIAGDVLAYNYETFFGTPLPYPAVSDALYLSVYPCLIGGLMMMIHRRNPGRDRASFIDSLMVSIGVGTISWVFLIAPYCARHRVEAAHEADLDLVPHHGPAADRGRGPPRGRRRQARPPFLLMMVAVLALFVTDAIYGWSAPRHAATCRAAAPSRSAGSRST